MAMSIGPELEHRENPAVSGLLKESQGETAADRLNTYKQAGREAKGLLNADSSFNTGLSYRSPQTDAIRSKYLGEFNKAQERVDLDLSKSATNDHVKKLAIATDLANQEIQINRQKAMMRSRIKRANKQARAQTIGAVLGIVGAGAGAFFGGPSGAVGGGMVGQGIGNAAAGGGGGEMRTVKAQ